MINFKTGKISDIGKNFIEKKDIPKGCDEFYLRDKILDKSIKYRNISEQEKNILLKNQNHIENPGLFFVTDKFNPELIKNSNFYGLIRINSFENIYLEYKDLRLPVGIYSSTIISCDIGDNVCIHNVGQLAHYIISDFVILYNVQEMITSKNAKFGNNILKNGDDKNSLIKIELGNENGNRAILAFSGILSADCYLWSKFRDDKKLLKIFEKWTQEKFDKSRGYYGIVEKNCVIKNSRSIKDVIIKEHTYIKGTNKLKNLTINSREDSPTQVGEGVELVNGIIGYGCRIFYGVKAVRFIMADHSQLKYGARLINSFLGENSTISCCEVLNSLIFPFHEQHHNNSFLIAGTICGQSNIAAGATIGSNHNSRMADGEIFAKRGFWPGLATNFKHFSKFSSFCIVEKGSYNYELNIEFPFSLISNDLTHNRLQIMPAFYLIYNMFALNRNPYKFKSRDKRKNRHLNLEFDYIAPDTIEDIFYGLELLKFNTGKSYLKNSNKKISDKNLFDKIGEDILNGEKEIDFEVFIENAENSKRDTVILKPQEANTEYKNVINYYGIKNIILWCSKNNFSVKEFISKIKIEKRKKWFNLGGQLFDEEDFSLMIEKIFSKEIKNWEDLHNYYKKCATLYEEKKLNHSIASLVEINNLENLNCKNILPLLEKSLDYSNLIYKRTLSSRQKDYTSYFRNITFNNLKEKNLVLGEIDRDGSIANCKIEQENFSKIVKDLIKSLQLC